MRIDPKIKMRLPWVCRQGFFIVPRHWYENSQFSYTYVAQARSSVILSAAGIQSPGYGPTWSWRQIFGGWTASRPARPPQHNLHCTQQGLWIPVATRMTWWGSRILTAARITANNETALGLPDAASGHILDGFGVRRATFGPYSQGRCLLGILATP